MNPDIANLVMSRCEQLAAYSEDLDQLTRRYLSEPMHEVHARLMSWMREIHLQPHIDNAGNIIGRRTSRTGSKILIVGSHLDTVPGAGSFDGVLGVLIGLAVVDRLRGHSLPFHLDVVGFSEEEGVRYNMPYLGSSAVAGLFQKEWLHRVDSHGISMRDAMTTFRLNPDKINESAYREERVIGFIEPHIEQGPVLERAGLPVGVVSGVAGQSRLRMVFEGEAGHAGTTPMIGRPDALVMASRFVQEVHALGTSTEGLRATVGRMEIEPNTPNVIAGSVTLSLDVRHMDDQVRHAAMETLLVAGKRIANAAGGNLVLLEESSQSAVAVDSELSDLLCDAIHGCGFNSLQLMSGAGHDAVIMAKKFPTALLFLRHPGGVSHHPDERVEVEDVHVAIEVLSSFVLSLAERVQEHLEVRSEQ